MRRNTRHVCSSRLASDEEVIEEETCDLAESGGLLLLWV